ncbi:hypothetical protein Lepto7376_1871 [[Leptolyngbya] sp. PCC 7376]|uniref:hypothetical protein n=1 Tax=[Leptolyngbya] sp. PCC 7376 TaxID=111781 RepID=UPI00029ED9F0|nr:hypothetical protein [[Leptolyngbya] sp. PCC 7376]AFY38191.1 hypothetical protein Lepto7376_1871 [[Leptolyngbya] sp. PCC 7376]
MSHQNPDSQQPNPFETEAFLDGDSPQTIDVSATATGSESSELNPLDPTALIPSSDELEADNDGFLLARKLRQHNRELVKTVVQLEQALAESQERLQKQIARSRNADSLLNQQADSLTGNQDELENLRENLKLAKENVREHRTMMNELNLTLKRSQTQLAQVERECTLLRESYDEQQQKLAAAEQEIQDLQARLQRQQRYAIQYKTALEQQGVQVDESNIPSTPIAKAPIPKVSRIQPWSEQKLEPKPLFPNNEVTTEVDLTELTSQVFPAEQQAPIATPDIAAELQEASVVLPPDINDDLEQQLKDLEAEMEAMSQEVIEEPETIAPKTIVQFPQLQTSVRQSNTPAPNIAQPTSPAPTIQRQPQQPMVAASGLPTQQKNFPSPTLNPLRTAKKRSSLAAVELPSFSRR